MMLSTTYISAVKIQPVGHHYCHWNSLNYLIFIFYSPEFNKETDAYVPGAREAELVDSTISNSSR